MEMSEQQIEVLGGQGVGGGTLAEAPLRTSLDGASPPGALSQVRRDAGRSPSAHAAVGSAIAAGR